MKEHLRELINQAILDLKREGVLPSEVETDVVVERTRSAEHGDFSSNVALTLAKPAKRNPKEIAEAVIERLLPSKHVEKAETAGPGFINFHLTRASLQSVVSQVLQAGDAYGQSEEMGGEKVTVEFVSANPTGPLHVGHGRGAAYGASLSNILDAVGYDVYREYYVNDHGRQMDILATSVWLRYLELCGVAIQFPANGYQGDYIYEIARKVRQTYGDDLRINPAEVTDALPADGEAGSDDAEEKAKREAHIDALIARAKEILGDGYKVCFNAALDAMVDDIREDLGDFNVLYENWFSEQDLAASGSIEQAFGKLRDAGHLYEEDGATFFRATEFGDEKDRVVVRENGQTTYFASDIAYMLNKFERGFETAIYVLGADHHGYIARLRAAAQGLGYDPDRIEILLVQFAHLFRDGEKLQMSTRSGKFVTLRELREEVGTDAARFFYVMRSHDQHLDFDLTLAKSQSNDNPVYYIQYAHARVASMLRKVVDEGWSHNVAIGEAALDRLTTDQEIAVLRALAQYPEVLSQAARNRSPHVVAYYLRDVAQSFHACYNSNKVLVDDEDLRNARLNLGTAVQQVLRNGLKLLGVSAPEQM